MCAADLRLVLRAETDFRFQDEGGKQNHPLPRDIGTLVLFLQFLAHTTQLKISPSARELFLLVRTHTVPNKGQGFLEKCSVAEKKEQRKRMQEDLPVPADDMGTKKILFEGSQKRRLPVS